jgi:hypothetical protein
MARAAGLAGVQEVRATLVVPGTFGLVHILNEGPGNPLDSKTYLNWSKAYSLRGTAISSFPPI